ncbi:helix-turn-helix domain-containing protein [Caproiciproducens sp. LBM24188]|nr:AraC family transcriptional regulator [Clostridiales bacterium]
MKIDGIHEKELFENSFPFRIIINNDIDFQYPPHWHNAVEILYIVKNEFTLFVNSKKIVLQEKDILFIPSGDIHEFKSETPTGTRIFLNFETTSLGCSYGFMQDIRGMLSHVRRVQPDETELYQAIKTEIDKILKEYETNGSISQLYYIARIIDILVLFCKSMPIQMRTDTLANGQRKVLGLEKINKTFEYIEKNYREDINLDDIANAVGFSKYYFSRIFKDITEKSFHQYLNEFRIKKAEELLENADISISQAAFESGFSSIATFDRLFKQIKGYTPQEYRKLRV